VTIPTNALGGTYSAFLGDFVTFPASPTVPVEYAAIINTTEATGGIVVTGYATSLFNNPITITVFVNEVATSVATSGIIADGYHLLSGPLTLAPGDLISVRASATQEALVSGVFKITVSLQMT